MYTTLEAMDVGSWNLYQYKAGLCYARVSKTTQLLPIPLTNYSIMNIVTDIMILSLPIKPVLGLHMKSARKLQVLGIFALGGMWVLKHFSS